MAETRAWELTADSFFTNVLGPLGADLALCVGDHESPNPLYERAKYVWRAKEPEKWGELYDREAGGTSWRVLLVPGAHLFGGIEDADQVGSGAIVLYFRRFLAESIEREGIADEYDWLVLTRSDLLWPIPHPAPRHLSSRHIYALDGEGYGGVEDRHLIVPRRFARRFLEVPAPVFSDPEGLKAELDRTSELAQWPVLNHERFLAARLRELGLWRHVKFLPYVPYAVRAPGGATRWAGGVLDEKRGFYVKYPSELESSTITQRFISDQESWGAYLAPFRGAPARWRLRAAYREHDLYERPFTLRLLRDQVTRELEDLPLKLEKFRHRLMVRAGSWLRRIPGLSPLLDARLRWIRRRASRSEDPPDSL